MLLIYSTLWRKFTLGADAGHYTLSVSGPLGQSISLGSFTARRHFVRAQYQPTLVDRAAASLLHGSVLQAGAGTFNLTGSANAFVVTEGADAGSFALTGAAATLAVTEGATAGTFNLSGADASFAITEGAGAGTFTLNGASAGFAVTLGADAGAFALSGASAGFAVTIGAAAGSFTINGQAVAFAVVEGADAGSFVINGADAALRSTNTRFSVDPGSFLITGGIAALTYTPINQYQPSFGGGIGGGWGFGGEHPPLRKPKRKLNLAAYAGEFVARPAFAGFGYAAVLRAESQTFQIVGKADMVRGLVLRASYNKYRVCGAEAGFVLDRSVTYDNDFLLMAA